MLSSEDFNSDGRGLGQINPHIEALGQGDDGFALRSDNEVLFDGRSI